MLNSTSQWRKEFVAKHGDRVPYECGYWLLFEDGFKLCQDPESHGEAAPDSKVERLKLSLTFHRVKQQRARRRFKELKTQILVTFAGKSVDQGIVLYEGDEKEAERELEEARAAVRRADKKKQNIERDLKIAMHGANWEERERTRRKSQAEHQASRERFSAKIKNIKV